MSQNQEIIESKLCAFIDDELDEEGRAEIERHLLANPQHRRLLEELRRTSGLVRTLPRDPAPTELAESFNGQLERSVLLQGLGDSESSSTTGTTRWPQMAALAAIVLLTVGLAGVVYLILPSLTHRPQIVQNLTRPPAASPATNTPSPAEGVLAPSDGIGGARDAVDAKREGTAASAAERSLAVSPGRAAKQKFDLDQAASGDELASVARLRDMARQAANDPQVAELSTVAIGDAPVAGDAQTDARVAGLGGNAVVMLIKTTDVGQARQELKDYFDANKIPWDSAVSDDQGSQGALTNSLRDDAGLAGATTLPTTQQGAPSALKESASADATKAKKDGILLEAKGQSDKTPSTLPDPIVATLDGDRKSVSEAAVSPSNIAAVQNGSSEAFANSTSGRLYLASRMTRRQAAYVGSLLSHEGVAQHVQIVSAPSRPDNRQQQLSLDQAAVTVPENAASEALPAPAFAARRSDDSGKPGSGGDSRPTTRDALATAIGAASARGSSQGILPSGAPAAASPAPGAYLPALADARAAASPLTPPEHQRAEQSQRLQADNAQTQPALALESSRLAANRDEPVDIVIVLQPTLAEASVPTTDPADALIPQSNVRADTAPEVEKAAAKGGQSIISPPAIQPAR